MNTLLVRLERRLLGAFALVVLASLCPVGDARSQGANPEVLELRAALKMTRDKLDHSKARRRELIKSLAEAVRVSEEQAFAAREVQEKMEAFGVDLFSSSKDSLEQRLLKAVRDLDIVRQESERRREAIHDLSEAFLNYLAATPGGEEEAKTRAREAIGKAGKSLEELVDPGQVPVRKLEDARIVSVDSSIGLIVLDTGRKSGVRIGTPITVEREDQPIYTALIVEVRDSISGALLQDKVGNQGEARVGDRIRPLVTETDF